MVSCRLTIRASQTAMFFPGRCRKSLEDDRSFPTTLLSVLPLPGIGRLWPSRHTHDPIDLYLKCRQFLVEHLPLNSFGSFH